MVSKLWTNKGVQGIKSLTADRLFDLYSCSRDGRSRGSGTKRENFEEEFCDVV